VMLVASGQSGSGGPLTGSCRSVPAIRPVRPCDRAVRQPSSPTCAGVGPVRRSGRAPGEHFPAPGGSEGGSKLLPPDAFPCGLRSHQLPVPIVRSALTGLAAATWHSSRSSQAAFEPTDSGAPLATFAVRWARPEGFAKRVFQRCCGHRRRPDQVEFFRSPGKSRGTSLQRFALALDSGPEGPGSFRGVDLPFRAARARL
jgi:hypothetical protein